MSINKSLEKAKIAHQHNKFNTAKKAYQKVLKQSPKNEDGKEAHRLISSIFLHEGNTKLALHHLQKAISINPTCHMSHCAIADLYFQEENYRNAEKNYQLSLSLSPNYVNAIFGLANTLKNTGEQSNAEALYKKAISINPKHISSRINLGKLLCDLKRYSEAIDIFSYATSIHPNDTTLMFAHALCLRKSGDFNGAIEIFGKIIKIDPTNLAARNHISSILSDHGHYDEAILFYRNTLSTYPNCAETHNNLANSLRYKGMINEAIHEYKAAIDINPDYQEAKIALSTSYIFNGNFEQGWKGISDYYYKTIYKEKPITIEHSSKKIIRTQSGIGIGDIFMYMRFIKSFILSNPNCSIECEDRVLSILKKSIPNIKTLSPLEASRLEKTTGVQHIPLASLPHHLKIKKSSEIEQPPYITPDSGLVQSLRKKYLRKEKHLLVGISWKSSGSRGEYRTISLEKWQDILSIPNIQFVNLQYGDTSETEQFPNILTDTSFDPISDLDTTIAQIAAMDLVITIDNSCLHFAGAMGINTWGILPITSDWRWGLDTTKSYWYNSVTLYRQDTPQDWKPVLQNICSALEALSPSLRV